MAEATQEYDNVDDYLAAMLQTPGEDGEPITADEIMEVPIVKAGKEYKLKVNLRQLDKNVYYDCVFRGLKVLLNAKMTKLASTRDMEDDEAQDHREAIMEV